MPLTIRGSIFAILLSVHAALGQNLVPNPGFEQYFRCPGSWNYKAYQKHLAPGWSTPTNGTPDLFNTCSTGDTGIPHNFAGTAKAHGGDGYAGIYVWHKNRDYREYLQTRLLHPLEKGKPYVLEFFFRLAQYSRYSIDRIGAALLADSIAPVSHDLLLPVVPLLQTIHDSAFHRSSGTWEKASLKFTATGTEKFLLLGNFSRNRDTKSFSIQFEALQQPMLANSAYFYIDDVRVEEIVSWDTITSPDAAMKPGLVYVLKSVNFEYDRDVLIPASYPELDKLVNILRQNPAWSITLTGHTDDRGSDDYNQRLSERRARRCGRYLTTAGIPVSRVATAGKGKSFPLAPGVNEQTRAANRRVEATFTSGN